MLVMEKLMNKIMKRFGAVCISIFMVFTLCMPCFADETQKTIRVGSFEDTFNYVDDHGVRRGYGYELMQALAGYTGWKFEYVKCDWSNCFDKLENGEIDIMGDISYTDDRAIEMLFSEETMGEEKYVLYANLSDMDIVPSDYKSLDGKRIGVLKGAKPEYMLTEWENKYGIHTEHVNVSGNEDVKKKLENKEIDVIYYASRNSNVAEKKGYALSNTAWTYSLMAVTEKEDFNENDSYVVAVPKNKVALKQHIAYYYPQWKLVDCDTINEAANMVVHGKVDCFIKGSSQVLKFDGNKNFKIISLTKTMEACFGVKDGQATLLSILNKTIKAMPSDMLTSAIAMYDSTAYKTTFYGFLKDHLAVVLILGFSIIIVILLLLRKARRAEASAKEANLAKTQFLHNVSHDIRTPMNAILGYSELMKNELKDNDLSKVVEHLNKLQKAGIFFYQLLITF